MAEKALKIKKVVTPLEELEIVSKLKDTVEWECAKRMAKRYIQNLKDVSFSLSEMNGNYLQIRHADCVGQARGILYFIKMIDTANKKASQLEVKNEKKEQDDQSQATHQ